MMNLPTPTKWPLVSVIIPCYNHGAYLPEALASIQQQDYPAVEVIIIDDGSTDNTKQVAQHHSWVNYIYQNNHGLSAARNAGISHSRGAYLVFLDADDWLLPGALRANAHYLRLSPSLAFVSGGHDKVFTATGLIKDDTQQVSDNHYEHLLRGNYIGMPAAVMYQRWVFDIFRYDPTLKVCEDYDLYLQIARAHPVAHHTQRVAAYRLHGTNMSSNIPLMLRKTLAVLKRQQPHLQTSSERQAFTQGQTIWKAYYCAELYQKLKASKRPATLAELATLGAFTPLALLRYFLPPHVLLVKKLLKS
ncbi:glycosyltransferase family 2 protein [uncultured Hymenobacter sp.]|uniref:glycosyltransferase family 2 protein n=1 Tax=uncultured Hymenobacter sp. TaxID=170016 RepID=UPI0035CB2B21